MGKYPIRLTVLFGIMVILLFQSGCGSDTMSSIITLEISPGTIKADGDETAQITATIIGYDGLPVNIGTSVLFTTSRGMFTQGSKSMTANTTDNTGTVKVYLFAPLGTNRGTAMIVCSSGGVSRTGKVEISAYGPPGQTAQIDLTADPDTIEPEGRSVIEATLTDGNSEPVYIGTSMTFTDLTNLGTFFQNGRNSITVATRDTTGTESVDFIASTSSGTARIECRSNGVVALVDVLISTIGQVHITLTASPDSIPADGETISRITATVTDPNLGTPVLIGTVVKFEVIKGLFTNGNTTFYDATDVSGVAVADFYAPVGTTPGIVQIKVTAMDASARIPVTVSGPCTTTPATITVAASPGTLPPDGTTLSTITATIRDAAGDPVCPGVPATFSSSAAPPTIVITDSSVTTNESGEAITQIFATLGSGVATITCTSGGVSGSTGVSVP